MSETNTRRSTPSFVIVLIFLLLAAVAIQAWYMVDMKQTIDDMQSVRGFSVPSETAPAIMDSAENTATGITTRSSGPAAIEEIREATVTASTGDLAIESARESAAESTREQTVDPRAQLAPPETNFVTPDNPANITPSAPLPHPDARDYFSNQPYYAQDWNPHEELLRMQRHMERLFNERHYRYGNRYPGTRGIDPDRTQRRRPDFHYQFRQDYSLPEMDMRENQNQYMVLVNIPGADQKDISVNLEGQRLTVSGRQEYKKQQSDPDGNFVFRERRSGKFQRSITLAEPVEKKGMKTQINNGILRIVIPKRKY